MLAQSGGEHAVVSLPVAERRLLGVLARTKDDAIVALDQVGNAEGCPITQVRTFQMHFALTDQGELALERFGEGTKEDVFAFAYPLLEHALDEAYRGEGYADYESLPPGRRG